MVSIDNGRNVAYEKHLQCNLEIIVTYPQICVVHDTNRQIRILFGISTDFKISRIN